MSKSPDTHRLPKEFSQHPLHVPGSHTHWPFLHAVPDPHDPPTPQRQVPKKQLSARVASQAAQTCALLPHAATVFPAWQVPFWQQPCPQFCALQFEHCPI